MTITSLHSPALQASIRFLPRYVTFFLFLPPHSQDSHTSLHFPLSLLICYTLGALKLVASPAQNMLSSGLQNGSQLHSLQVSNQIRTGIP